jgi:hypothetical protein
LIAFGGNGIKQGDSLKLAGANLGPIQPGEGSLRGNPVELPDELSVGHEGASAGGGDRPFGLAKAGEVEDMEKRPPHDTEPRARGIEETAEPSPVRQVKQMMELGITNGLFATRKKRLKTVLVPILMSESLDIASERGGIEAREAMAGMDARHIRPHLIGRRGLGKGTGGARVHGEVAAFDESRSEGKKVLAGRTGVSREAVGREVVTPRARTPEMAMLHPAGPTALLR